MIRDTLRRQEGSALVTALLVMTLCLMIGFTTMSMVDVQQSQSRGERERESSFALAEGALNGQIFMLSTEWPASADGARPRCTQETAGERTCPDPTTLAKGFTGADYAAGVQWSTELHDNVPTINGQPDQFYDDAAVRAQPGWDQNDDGLMWVRAQARVRGRLRTLVALIRAERLDTLFPNNVITANRIEVTNEGNKTMVQTNGSYLVLRCDDPTREQPLSTAECNASKPVQVGPNATVTVNPAQPAGLSPETIEHMREYAKAHKTYFADGCPNLTGEVVFLERANCEYTSNPEFNTADKPGVLIIGSGTISIGPGTATYHGVIYHVNGSDEVGPVSTGTVVRLHGNGCVDGAVVIDGPGGLEIGSSGGASKCGGNLGFNPNASQNLHAYGTAGIVQNSFREIVASN